MTHSEILIRSRRQLLVTVDDGSDTCVLRFLNFYPSHQKTLSVGARVRVRGEMRGGFLGREMMHPHFKLAGGELPGALTPVYPTVGRTAAGLSAQGGAQRPGAGRPQRDDSRAEFLSKNMPLRLSSLREALQFLHHPTPDVALQTLEDRSHPAWQRLKAEELLAQQLSQLQARRVRAAMRAPALNGPAMRGAHCTLQEQLLERLPFRLTGAQQRVGEEIEADLARTCPCTACCRATWARAKPWWPRWPRRAASTRAGSAR